MFKLLAHYDSSTCFYVVNTECGNFLRTLYCDDRISQLYFSMNSKIILFYLELSADFEKRKTCFKQLGHNWSKAMLKRQLE